MHTNWFVLIEIGMIWVGLLVTAVKEESHFSTIIKIIWKLLMWIGPVHHWCRLFTKPVDFEKKGLVSGISIWILISFSINNLNNMRTQMLLIWFVSLNYYIKAVRSATCWQSTIKIVAKQEMQSIGSKIVVQSICVHRVCKHPCS